MEGLTEISRKTLRLDAQCPLDIKKAKDILKALGIVALPTETVYGLAAHGLSKVAISKVFEAKNRPQNNPLILHVSNQEAARLLFDFSSMPDAISKRFDKLAHAFWPGPLTIVAKKAPHIPMEAVGSLRTAAVRVPDNAITKSLLVELDFPLVMPSANLSTRPSPTCMQHVLKTLDGRIDAVVDGGPSRVGIESTVVKIDDDEVKLLRLGSIDKIMLKDCLNESITIVNKEELPLAPGQSFLHYSPLVNSVHVVDQTCLKEPWLGNDTILLKRADFSSLERALGKRPDEAESVILSDDEKIFAQELYQALYLCEQKPHKSLYILLPQESSGMWCALIDRLRRSAGLGAHGH